MRWWCMSLWVGLLACSAPTSDLRIGVAASVYPAMLALQAEYEAQTGQRLALLVQASGQLTAQIEQGLDLDVFVSADTSYPHYLYQKGHAAAPPICYAQGQLALWVAPHLGQPQDWTILNAPQLERLALANPAVAPYGVLAVQALKEAGHASEQGWVYGESVAQVNHYMATKSVDAALTAASSLVDTTQFDPQQYWIIPTHHLAQSLILIQPKDRPVKDQAHAFYAFLQSPKAQHIWQTYGYRLPADTPF